MAKMHARIARDYVQTNSEIDNSILNVSENWDALKPSDLWDLSIEDLQPHFNREDASEIIDKLQKQLKNDGIPKLEALYPIKYVPGLIRAQKRAGGHLHDPRSPKIPVPSAPKGEAGENLETTPDPLYTGCRQQQWIAKPYFSECLPNEGGHLQASITDGKSYTDTHQGILFSTAVGGLASRSETLVPESGPVAWNFVGKCLTDIIEENAREAMFLVVVGSSSGLSPPNARCIFENETQKIRNWLKNDGTVIVMYDGDPIPQGSAAADKPTPEEAAVRQQQEIDEALRLRATNQPYYSITSNGEMTSNSNAQASTAKGPRTEGIGSFLVYLLLDPILRAAEVDGKLVIVQVPGQKYFDGKKAPACCRPPGHFMAPQGPTRSYNSYTEDGAGIYTLQGGSEARWSMLEYVLRELSKRPPVHLLCIGGGPSARTEIAALLGVDWFDDGRFIVVKDHTGNPLVQIVPKEIVVYNAPALSERTKWKSQAPTLPKDINRNRTLPCDLAWLVLAASKQSPDGYKIPEPVLLALQAWAAEQSCITNANGTNVQCFKLTRDSIPLPRV